MAWIAAVAWSPALALPKKILLNLFIYLLFKASYAAYGGSQGRGLTEATAASLCQSHSNVRSELHLQPTPQLTATPDP